MATPRTPLASSQVLVSTHVAQDSPHRRTTPTNTSLAFHAAVIPLVRKDQRAGTAISIYRHHRTSPRRVGRQTAMALPHRITQCASRVPIGGLTPLELGHAARTFTRLRCPGACSCLRGRGRSERRPCRSERPHCHHPGPTTLTSPWTRTVAAVARIVSLPRVTRRRASGHVLSGCRA